jgi:hypothetical protein
MQVKLFEVRDSATFIPCFGILMVPTSETQWGEARDVVEEYLLRRAGFGFDHPPYLVMFGRLEGRGAEYDPYNWPGSSRTIRQAHIYVTEHWNELKSGAVIDVEFTLGERTEPKVSERTQAKEDQVKEDLAAWKRACPR